MRAKRIMNENYHILTTNDTNTLSSEEELPETPLGSSPDGTLPNQVCFYFKNRSFLLLIVQPLSFILQLHQLRQPYIPKRTLILTNMIWRTNGLNNRMQSWKPWYLSYVIKKVIEDLLMMMLYIILWMPRFGQGFHTWNVTATCFRVSGPRPLTLSSRH